MRGQDYIFRPGKTYLIRLRVKPLDTNGTWDIRPESSGGTNRGMGLEIDPGTMDVGAWYEGECIWTNGGTANQKLLILSNSTSASALVVDYVNAFEVTTQRQQVDAEHWGGRYVGRGTAAPTTGTWVAGDVVLNDSLGSGNRNFGWLCVTSGTPGTWFEFGWASNGVATFAGLTASGNINITGTNPNFNPAGAGSQLPDWSGTEDSSDGATAIAVQGMVVTTNDTTRKMIRFRASGSNKSGSGGIALGDFDQNDYLLHRYSAGPFRVDYLPYTGGSFVNALSVDAANGINWRSGTYIKRHLSATKTWDPASVLTAAATSTTVTVTGAAVGDTVAVGFSTAVPAGVLLVGAVTAADTVTVTLANLSGSTQDLASGTLRADVWQH